jgi:hypothetical protein
LRVEDGHLFRDNDKEESRLFLVCENAGRGVDAVLDVLEFAEDLVFLGLLVTPHDGRHPGVFFHLFAQGGDLANPLVVDAGHAQVVESVAERHQVVDVIVVLAADDDVDYAVKNGALFHGWLGGRGLNIFVDLWRYLVHAVRVQDSLADLVLVFLDPPVGVNFLGKEVGHDLDGPFAKDVLLKDVA